MTFSCNLSEPQTTSLQFRCAVKVLKSHFSRYFVVNFFSSSLKPCLTQTGMLARMGEGF